MNIVDLHVHSTKSDGTYTPTQLVDYAVEKGLSAFWRKALVCLSRRKRLTHSLPL